MCKYNGCTYTGVIFHAVPERGGGGGLGCCVNGKSHFPTPHVEWKTVQVNMSHHTKRSFGKVCVMTTITVVEFRRICHESLDEEALFIP